MMSVGPPAAAGAMRVMARLGYVSACAAVRSCGDVSAAAPAVKANCRRDIGNDERVAPVSRAFMMPPQKDLVLLLFIVAKCWHGSRPPASGRKATCLAVLRS